MDGLIRLIQIALLLAIIIPFGMAVRGGVGTLSDYWLDMGIAALVGFGTCFALWRWDERIRQREGDDRR